MSVAADHPDDEVLEPRLEEVAAGVFAYVQLDGSWGLNNPGFLVGEHGVTLIDTCFTERRSRDFLAAVTSVTDRPLRTLVNTHHHGDHTHGNWLVPAATIIGHELGRDEMIASGHGTTGVLPRRRLGDDRGRPALRHLRRAARRAGRRHAGRVSYQGPAHTTNDVIAWLPERRSSSPATWCSTAARRSSSWGRWPGRSPRLSGCGRSAPTRSFPATGRSAGPRSSPTRSRTCGSCRRPPGGGSTPVCRRSSWPQATDLGRFAGWHDPERIVGNLWRAYSELRGEPLGAPVSPQAFADMVTYNGGRPLAASRDP